MTTERVTADGNQRAEDQHPNPKRAEPPNADESVLDKPRTNKPAPPHEPTKDAPSFPPGSPETVPPGPTSG